MPPTMKHDKWLLILWSSGGRDIIHLKSVISPVSEAKVGTVIIAVKGKGSHEAASVIGYSHNRQTLERRISLKTEPEKELRQVETQTAEEMGDNEEFEEFSASASEWEPSDDHPSSDEEVERRKTKERKKIKAERFSRSYSRRDIKPSNKADAVNKVTVKSLNREKNYRQIEGETSNITDKRSLADLTRVNNSPVAGPSDTVSINIQQIMEMKQCFEKIFNIIGEIKCSTYPKSRVVQQISNSMQGVVTSIPNYTANQDIVEEECGMSYRSEDLNSSDDNVLRTNKYDTANSKILTELDKNQNAQPDKLIPIGSGKTLIQKDKYNKIKWKSFTVATRSLLEAAFSRRILATHSLTGKRSPAFQDKPAKTRLDPKIVSDIIIEVTDRFNVKENLVRSIITTKCADDCKIYRNKQKHALNKRKSLPASANKENADVDEEDNDANMTC